MKGHANKNGMHAWMDGWTEANQRVPMFGNNLIKKKHKMQKL